MLADFTNHGAAFQAKFWGDIWKVQLKTPILEVSGESISSVKGYVHEYETGSIVHNNLTRLGVVILRIRDKETSKVTEINTENIDKVIVEYTSPRK